MTTIWVPHPSALIAEGWVSALSLHGHATGWMPGSEVRPGQAGCFPTHAARLNGRHGWGTQGLELGWSHGDVGHPPTVYFIENACKMEVFHHFGLRVPSESVAREFSDIGIELQCGPRHTYGSSIASIDIGERDERWIAVREIATKYKITEFVTTKFSEEEINAADALCIFAKSHRGYPEPSREQGYLATSYDLSTFCAKCGTGLRQINPLRINSKPNLKHDIMQLNWIFDEFFVAREVWTEVFEPLGIGYWPVLLDRTREVIESVVQLRISHRADLNLSESGASLCSTCGRTKTRMNLRGFCPMPTRIPAPIFKSTQYFGSDASAFNLVVVSSSLYKDINKNRLRGTEFYPCRPSVSRPEI